MSEAYKALLRENAVAITLLRAALKDCMAAMLGLQPGNDPDVCWCDGCCDARIAMKNATHAMEKTEPGDGA